jgi:FlaA1/EpsC-like NDP-sugar epimerase
MNRRSFLFLLLDILFVLVGFWLSVLFKQSSFSSYFVSYAGALGIFGVIWVLISHLFNKYDFDENKITDNTRQIILSNLSVLAISAILIYFLRNDRYSRFIVLFTVGFTTVIEIGFLMIFWPPRVKRGKGRIWKICIKQMIV